MNRNQRVRTKYLGALWAAVLAFVVIGCGVEVGNPSEPTGTAPKGDQQITVPGMPTVPIDSVNPVEPVEPVKIDVRYLVENQYDEAITAALDFAFDNTTVALALAGTDTRSCGVLADGSLGLNHQETNSDTRPSGAAADATLITESFSRVFGSKMVSPGKTLACNTSLTKPKIDWGSISELKIDGTLERSNSRTIMTDPGQLLVRESSVKSIGTQQASVKKIKYDPQNSGLSLQRTLSFGTDMEINNKTMTAAPTLLKTRIETLSDSPLMVSESYNTDSKLKSLKIVSGVTSSVKQDDGLVVIMRYDNVNLDADGTCRPSSGTIMGEVYLPNDPTKVAEKFSIAFTEKDNLIVYADGTGSKLEFEPCRIQIENTSPNNGGYNGGRGGR